MFERVNRDEITGELGLFTALVECRVALKGYLEGLRGNCDSLYPLYVLPEKSVPRADMVASLFLV